jgi:hypothetical protein
MDFDKERFLEISRRHFAVQPAATTPVARARARALRREANRFPQTAAVRAAITLLRRCSI